MNAMPPARAAALLLALAAGWPAPGQANPAASGQYGSLTLVVRDGEVSGTFSEARGGNGTQDAPQFSCLFQLRGTLRDGRGTVQTWSPGGESIPGQLALEEGAASLVLRDNQDGCLMATGDMVRQPYRAPLARRGEGWIGATLVAAPRAVINPTPQGSNRRGPYVVEGDAVVVLERRPGWARVRYEAGRAPVTGWVRAGELAPEQPPPQ